MCKVALQRQIGLTLLELVVSLLVLTILTTVAIRSVSGIQEQARYETTRKLLGEFRRAILGDGDWSSGVFGYAFDLATFPENLRQLLSPSTTLWNPSLAAVSYYYDNSTKPQTQELGYGWRGPYLAVNASAGDPSALRDGFGGREGSFDNDTTNYGWYVPTSLLPTTLMIRSFGADRKEGPPGNCGQDTDYEEDCEISLKSEEYQFTPRNVTVSLTPVTTASFTPVTVFLAIFARCASPSPSSCLNHVAAAFSDSTVVKKNEQCKTFTFSSSTPPLTAGPVLIGLFRCDDSYPTCLQSPPKSPPNIDIFNAGSRRVYPDGHRLLYWQVRPKSNSFMIYW
jgi:type II secretory pathway pseudopilin PulG